MRLTRTRHGWARDWWRTVDRTMIALFATLLVLGIILSLAASPAVADRIGILDDLHFSKRQLLYALPAFAVMVIVSMLSPRHIRRLCLAVFAVGMVLMVMTLFIGPEVKGSRRWLRLMGFTLQPSEFVKPAFVVLAAWAFAQSGLRKDMPALPIAAALLAVFAGLLLLQPDFGQTLLVGTVWGVLFFLSGMPFWTIGILGGLALFGVVMAYLTLPHVASRIDRFLDPEAGDTFQVDRAMESFERGGLLGQGPGEGRVKLVLPDAHTDFIFAVIGEELGIVVALALVTLFLFIVLRGLWRSLMVEDPFQRLAGAGLMSLFGVQAFINFGVNTQLLPAKGMTLPFISYGGSSLLAMGFGMGCALAALRLRARDYRTSLGVVPA